VSDNSPDESQDHTIGQRPASTFVLSREQFDLIPNYRARYILCYIAICIIWVAPKIIYLITQASPPESFAPVYYVVFIGVYIPFYYFFTKAMRTMGYPLIWIIPTLLVVTSPFPGILAMGYMDRKIADAWDKADQEHESYRQRVLAEDDEDED
jgi:hypothetical protein